VHSLMRGSACGVATTSSDENRAWSDSLILRYMMPVHSGQSAFKLPEVSVMAIYSVMAAAGGRGAFLA
jgi:hypothetical protein